LKEKSSMEDIQFTNPEIEWYWYIMFTWDVEVSISFFLYKLDMMKP
jgi:hypothetical protein